MLGSFKAGEKLWKILWKRHREFVPGEPKEGLPKAFKKLFLPSTEGKTKEEHLLQGIGAILESSCRGFGKWICQAT